MPVPKYHELTLPMLKYLKMQTEAVTIADIKNTLAIQLSLTDEDLAQQLPSGLNMFSDRLSWAKTYLLKAGLIEQPKRAFCQISELGNSIDLSNLKIIDNNFLNQFESFVAFKSGKVVENGGVYQSAIVNQNEQTPEESIEVASKQLKESLKDELLDKIKKNSPRFFEQLVVDLLVAMGYGGSHQDAAQAIGKTNDGGIDGVISEDRLGLDKIYIQAKRWENTVGRPDIQQFKGALADQVAKKGVFITTSNFSKEAVESAKKSGIVLIDGSKLTSLMIEFGLGVQIERSFHIYKIDQDRFDEDNF